ncbi:hypothetical protein BD779DRAFT_1522978 [Infundibulicybe gibba]|nr:hypothetical protein BD779DRAFT_1522978 [Infundibulicybe gibba]
MITILPLRYHIAPWGYSIRLRLWRAHFQIIYSSMALHWSIMFAVVSVHLAASIPGSLR